MKMKFGAIVVDGRGKIGGHVASKNRGGAYLRTKVTPSNPNTVAQAAARARVTQLSQQFGSLTPAEISAWNAAVEAYAQTDIFGDIKNPSGLNLFVKLNSNLLEIGSSGGTVPPVKESVGTMIIDTAAAAFTGNTFTIATVEAAIPADTNIIVRVTPMVSPGISNFSGRSRNLVVKTAVDSPNTFDIFTEYTAKYGNLQSGQKVQVELVPVNTNTGQKGAVSKATLIVGA